MKFGEIKFKLSRFAIKITEKITDALLKNISKLFQMDDPLMYNYDISCGKLAASLLGRNAEAAVKVFAVYLLHKGVLSEYSKPNNPTEVTAKEVGRCNHKKICVFSVTDRP